MLFKVVYLDDVADNLLLGIGSIRSIEYKELTEQTVYFRIKNRKSLDRVLKQRYTYKEVIEITKIEDARK